jgi:ABC-type transport system involved in multi-copper enzyme maturation permease subunit
MTPESAAAALPKRSLREWLTRNPVVLKELRGRMRGARAFWVLGVYLLLMSAFVTLLYVLYAASTNSVGGGSSVQLVGKFVFGAIVAIELFLVCFIAPAFTAGAISGERERQTYDLLRTTLLAPRALVFGKLASALSYVFLLLLAALPLQSLAFLLGGVAPQEVFIASAVLIASTFLFGAAGLFFSSVMRRTLGATVMTYAFALFTTLGLPLLLLAVVPLTSLIYLGTDSPGLLAQILLLYGFGALIATNPIATIITTEVLLVDQQTAFYFTLPLSGPNGASFNAPLVSPWLPFVLFCFALGTGLALLSVHFVRRIER